MFQHTGRKHNNNLILPLACSNTDLSQKIDRRRTGSFALWLLLRRRRRRRIPRAANHSSFFFSGLLPSNGTTKAFVKENLFTCKKGKKKIKRIFFLGSSHSFEIGAQFLFLFLVAPLFYDKNYSKLNTFHTLGLKK